MNNATEVLNELDIIKNTNSFSCDISNLHQLVFAEKLPTLSIITQNVRSIYKNYDDFSVNLTQINQHIDVLVLTECRLNENIPLPFRYGYYTYNTTRKVTQNDGVVIYVRNNVEHSVREVHINDASCLEICLLNCTILCIYRSPSNHNTDNFLNSLDLHLKSKSLCKNVIVTGDININILENHEDSRSIRYLEMMAQHGLLPSHRLNTRINSCIDHVFADLDPNKYSATIAVLNTSVTDHLMTLTNIYAKTEVNHIKKFTKVHVNFKEAINSLFEHDLVNLLKIEEPNSLTDKLINVINTSLITNTKTVKIPNTQRIIKPWMTPGLLKCIRNRNQLQKQAQQDKENETNMLIYKRYRNFCNNLLKKLKRKYERDILSKSLNNPKSLWQSIKSITNLKNNKKNM